MRKFNVINSFVSDKPAGENVNMEPQTKEATCSRKNPLVRQTSFRMYEKRDETGDITFKVGAKEFKAHKCVLAALSPFWMARFYGKHLEESSNTCADVFEEKDASPEAFEQYLQFYYLDEINLTHDHIKDILKLTDRSSVTEFVNECFKFLEETLSSDNVCLCYHLAMLYSHVEKTSDLILSCEDVISSHSDEIFASDWFISCTEGDLFNILQSESFNCKEIDVFDACILWAKNSCTVNELDPENMENLRKTLMKVVKGSEGSAGSEGSEGNLLYQIRFGSMKIEDFMKCYKNYKNVFTEEERDEILFKIGKVSVAETNRTRFDIEPRDVCYRKWDDGKIINCDRVIGEKPLGSFVFCMNQTTFYTNRPILLGGFHCAKLLETNSDAVEEKSVTLDLSIVRKNALKDTNGKTLFNSTEHVTFRTTTGTFVKLRRPIVIKPNFVYEIQLKIKKGFSVKNYEFLNEVKIGEIVKEPQVFNTFGHSIFDNFMKFVPGTETIVKFGEMQSLVTRLQLNLCHAENPSVEKTVVK